MSATARKGQPLTKREKECLRLVAGGFINSEVAAGLGIHEDTVKFHLHSVFAKLNTANRVGAVVAALQLGLFQLESLNVMRAA